MSKATDKMLDKLIRREGFKRLTLHEKVFFVIGVTMLTMLTPVMHATIAISVYLETGRLNYGVCDYFKTIYDR